MGSDENSLPAAASFRWSAEHKPLLSDHPAAAKRGTVVVGCHVDASCGARRFAAFNYLFYFLLCDPCWPSEISAVAKLIVSRPSLSFPLAQSARPCATMPLADSTSPSSLFAAYGSKAAAAALHICKSSISCA